jgi:hypothetical protein
MQFKHSGFKSYYLYENMLLVFLDLVALATFPERFIRDIPLLTFDLIEVGPFF